MPPPSTPLETAYALNLTTLTVPSAASVLNRDQHLHDITGLFPDGNWNAYISKLEAKLTPAQKERAGNGNLVKGQVVYSSLFTNDGEIVASSDEIGDDLVFQRKGGLLEVNNVKVTRPDVLVANGVLHGLAR